MATEFHAEPASKPEASLEPWLRGTLTEVDPVRRAVLHALELTSEDVKRWCIPLTEAQLFARPSGLPPVAFQLRHIARSLDRLLSYAEGKQLTGTQLAALSTEMSQEGSAAAVMHEFHAGLEAATQRIRALSAALFLEPRTVGRRRLPTTVAGLLIHCAEHTQRHNGQCITTAKIQMAAS
jgi:uncharacterized damage-inducible protein DinB